MTRAAWLSQLRWRAAHWGWEAAQRVGVVTADTPAGRRFAAFGRGSMAAFPPGSVFGEGSITTGNARIARLRRFWGLPGGIRYGSRQRGRRSAEAGRVLVPCFVGNQVGAVAFRGGVFGVGDQEFARLGELVGVPAGIQRSLPQYQVRVAWFTHPQADTNVHLRADGGIAAHRGQRRPLGRGDQVDRYCTAPASDRIGVFVGFFGKFRVFIGDDNQRGIIRDRLPGALSRGCHRGGPLVEFGYRIARNSEYTAITPAAYLDRLRRYPARMFAASADSDAAGESDRQRTVARIWQLSLQAIADEQPLAGEILRTLAWFNPDPIPRDLACQLHDDPLTVDDALALLRTYSMITLTPQSITIHRLVQAVARTPDPADPYRTPEVISEVRDRAARLLLESLPENPLWNVPSWSRWRELLPHVLALTDHVGPGQDTPTTASILLAASGYLQGDGHFDQAIASARRAVDAYQQLHGPDTLDTLTACSYLASAYRAAGDLAAAAPCIS